MRVFQLFGVLGLLLRPGLVLQAASLPDRPFLQDVSIKFQNSAALTNATFLKLCLDKDNVAYVLTDKGVARPFGETLALDQSFRPLAGKVAQDITLGPSGDLYYLFEDQWLSNGENGKPLGAVPQGQFNRLAVALDGSVLLTGKGSLGLAGENGIKPLAQNDSGTTPSAEPKLFTVDNDFLLVSEGKLERLDSNGRRTLLAEGGISTVASRGEELLLGTHNGYYSVDKNSGAITNPRQTKLPSRDITRIVSAKNGVWFGTTHGAFVILAGPAASSGDGGIAKEGAASLPAGPNQVRYYASRRWLWDDAVVDLAVDRDGHVWVLTKAGLSKIEFQLMTLAEKANFFDRKVRARHIRFGLTAERRLLSAGDIASSEMIDTDNDGGWSSYYLASQAFRFAVTGSEQAKANAWETFGALERLQTINPLSGFPARTMERAGFKVSDPDCWRAVPGNRWEWKGTTSSDEIASQTFAHAVMWECAAKTEAERQRISTNYTRMVDHILAHDLHLIDVDGQPTLWGRWNPEYVNHYPVSIFDRRLNSAEIVASLQLAYLMTNRDEYRQKAEELFAQHGYLTNILSGMNLIKATPGFVHLGIQMGDEWNHSDDELAFVTYWVLYRDAFNDDLRAKFGPAIREHWELERPEQYPMWNFIYAGCGGLSKCDPEGAVWTLQGFPLDTVTWQIENAHRKDLSILPNNFMRREMRELLPPGERQITRCNTQPFILDGGDGGHTEFPGDEFLLGYWMGRYLKLID